MSGMRIIGGRHRGKRLESPPDRSIRPTAERAREALFNILDHGGLIVESRFLDLFCGTGAIGLEAWSRGAAEVWLIDRDIGVAGRNVAALGRPAGLHLQRRDVDHLGRAPSPFDVAFLDPPYRSNLAAPALAALERGWLADGAMVVVELAARETLEPPSGFETIEDRTYGAARLVFLRAPGRDNQAQPS